MSMPEIYGTLGPACADEETLKEMLLAGMTGMRLNMSHTSLAESAALIDTFHAAAKAAGVVPELLIDLQGPELRIGSLKDSLVAETGSEVILVPDVLDCLHKNQSSEIRIVDTSNAQQGENTFVTRTTHTIPVPAAVLEAAAPRDHILLDDGKIELNVLECTEGLSPEHPGSYSSAAGSHKPSSSSSVLPSALYCRILRGGALLGHKSVKIVGKDVSSPALTPQDRINLADASSFGVTAVMQPFVRSGEDLRVLRQALKDAGADSLRVFAKIENRAGMEHLSEILPWADMIVIARGDLGNDMPLWELPAAQDTIASACRLAQKPFLVVTQMLDSMVRNPVPTRAEVSDIYHAVKDGASAVMVTNETAIGAWPTEVIQYLVNTAKSAAR